SWKEMRIRSLDRLLGFPSGFPLEMVPPKNLDEKNSFFPHDSVLTIKNSLSYALGEFHSSIFTLFSLDGNDAKLRVHGEDIPKTEFRKRYRHFEFTVMPFGLINAPTVFTNLMNRVCNSYLDKFIIVFIDDILIYSKSKEEHEVHLKLVLELLKKKKLFVKFSKCEFWLQEVHFLGHVELNMRQKRWIELFSDYECEIRFYSRKANVVANALSKKEGVKPRRVSKVENTIAEMLRGLEQLMERKEDGGMYFIWVPLIGDVRTLIMNEAHASRYLVHSKSNKTYYDLRDMYGSQKALGTRLDMSAAHHPQTNGQSECTIQTLEDMLRACVIDFGGSWDVHLPLAEFSYNNSYHSSIRCASFEALYGRKCRSPVLGVKIGESRLIRPKLVQETTDKVVSIKEKLKVAKDRQKSYSNNRRKPLEFEVRDQVVLKVVGPVAYRLILPEELSSVHVPLDEIKVDKTLRFVEEPVEIIDRKVKSLKRSKISIIEVHWNSKRGPEIHMGQNFLKEGIL
nr:putative reverse transcriptase domain-containing protein [Tanacetum cinerariifolium]